jgi:hypothetical protein
MESHRLPLTSGSDETQTCPSASALRSEPQCTLEPGIVTLHLSKDAYSTLTRVPPYSPQWASHPCPCYEPYRGILSVMLIALAGLGWTLGRRQLRRRRVCFPLVYTLHRKLQVFLLPTRDLLVPT